MLLTLNTLKSRSFRDQVRVIERLTKQNLDRVEAILRLLEDRSEDRIFRVSVSGDREKVVQVALLAVVAADITTIPEKGARVPYRRRLDRLCRNFSIDVRDLSQMVRYVSQIERLLVDETQSPKRSGQ